MEIVLDTHTLIWFLSADAQLSETARLAIESPSNTVYVSYASLWELTIKHSLGKLILQQPLEYIINTILPENTIVTYHLNNSHLLTLQTLPYHHRDPFDRMIAAQVLTDNKILLSKDTMFDSYGINRIW